MGALRCLIYASQASPRCKENMDVVVVDILRASVRNNGLIGVSGMLLAHDGWFLQALEGSEVGVQTVFRKVGQDDRHRNIRLLSNTPVARRSFRDWAMCGRNVTKADDEILQVLSRRQDVDPHKMRGGEALKLLQVIHGIHLRTAHLQTGRTEPACAGPPAIVWIDGSQRGSTPADRGV